MNSRGGGKGDAVTLADLLAGVIFAALNAYAVLAGADFGGGVWALLARGPRQERQRDLIAHAIGPVWEANHVWLILAIVLLFTGFPAAFARLGIALHIPLSLVLIGIVLLSRRILLLVGVVVLLRGRILLDLIAVRTWDPGAVLIVRTLGALLGSGAVRV